MEWSIYSDLLLFIVGRRRGASKEGSCTKMARKGTRGMCLCIHNPIIVNISLFPSPRIQYVASQQEPNQEHSRRRGGHHATESPTQSASTQAEIELRRSLT